MCISLACDLVKYGHTTCLLNSNIKQKTIENRICISLTCDFRNLEDKSSRQREVSKSWAVNCNIRRLFACEWVSLDSSDFLFLSSESHFSTLKMTKNQALFTLDTSDIHYKKNGLLGRNWGVRGRCKVLTTTRNMICQVSTSFNWSCFIKHIRKITIFRDPVPQAFWYFCSWEWKRKDVSIMSKFNTT